MAVYEIRIFGADGAPMFTVSEIHAGNAAAIHAARKLAGGNLYEVWRGQDCIACSPPLRRKRARANPEVLWRRRIESQRAARSLPFLVGVIDELPMALGIFDRAGRILCHSGAMRRVMGDAIPSRDGAQTPLWNFRDGGGAPIAPPDWPGARALRGETIVAGFDGLYRHPTEGGERLLHVTAMPLKDGQGFAGGAALVQDYDPAARARNGLRDTPEPRFVQTLFETLARVMRLPEWSGGEAVLRAINEALRFPKPR